MASFGDGLGSIVGGILGHDDISKAQAGVSAATGAGLSSVNNTAADFKTAVTPYNNFGQSFLDPATAGIGEVHDAAKETLGYNDFMKSYTNTPAAQYQLQQANAVQDNSAASRGSLLSGANERALGTIDNGIVAGNANAAYGQYLAGNNQQFGQLETALGNMFSAIGVGQTSTGQLAGVDTAQMGATASMTNANVGATAKLGEAQGKNDQGKGSGLGSMFSNLGAAAFMF